MVYSYFIHIQGCFGLRRSVLSTHYTPLNKCRLWQSFTKLRNWQAYPKRSLRKCEVKKCLQIKSWNRQRSTYDLCDQQWMSCCWYFVHKIYTLHQWKVVWQGFWRIDLHFNISGMAAQSCLCLCFTFTPPSSSYFPNSGGRGRGRSERELFYLACASNSLLGCLHILVFVHTYCLRPSLPQISDAAMALLFCRHWQRNYICSSIQRQFKHL